MLWPLQDIIPFGAEHSTLDGVVKRAAERLHLALSPTPCPNRLFYPQRSIFLRQTGHPRCVPHAGTQIERPENRFPSPSSRIGKKPAITSRRTTSAAQPRFQPGREIRPIRLPLRLADSPKTRSAPRGMPTIFSATITRGKCKRRALQCVPWLTAAASIVVKIGALSFPGMVEKSWRPSGRAPVFAAIQMDGQDEETKIIAGASSGILTAGHAHIDFESAVKDWPADLQGKKTGRRGTHAWEVLEQHAYSQWDILEFTRNPKHVCSPEFPAGYWPKTPAPSRQ